MRIEEALSEVSRINMLILITKYAYEYVCVQSIVVVKLVNLQNAGIFKRILEWWNPAKNAKRFAKSGGRKIWIARVYHPGVNHDAALRKANGLLTPDTSPIAHEECSELALLWAAFEELAHPHAVEQTAGRVRAGYFPRSCLYLPYHKICARQRRGQAGLQGLEASRAPPDLGF